MSKLKKFKQKSQFLWILVIFAITLLSLATLFVWNEKSKREIRLQEQQLEFEEKRSNEIRLEKARELYLQCMRDKKNLRNQGEGSNIFAGVFDEDDCEKLSGLKELK